MCADISGINVIPSGISDYRISLIQSFGHATSALVGFKFLLVVLIIPQVSTQGASYIQYYGEGCDYRGGYRIWIKAACFHLVKNNASEKSKKWRSHISRGE